MMTSAIELLKRLSPPIRPGRSFESSASSTAATGFDAFLSLMASGPLMVDEPVTDNTPSGSAEHRELFDEAQLGRIKDAAKDAEKAGFARALVLIDSRAVVLDVAKRTIIEHFSSEPNGTRLVELDGAVIVPEEGSEHADKTRQLVLPSQMPPGIYEQMTRAREAVSTTELDRTT